MARARRLTMIAQLLSSHRFASQEAVGKALARAGIETTQATLSRDLRSLGVAKRADADGGSWYELPHPALETLDRERRRLDLRSFVNEVRVAQNLVVVRTPPGHANAVGRAIDLAEYAGVVGTVAGDDTVLLVSEDAAGARRLKRELESLANGGVK